ncbi:MAG TPA: type II toxin-antitoxin system RelE/ParE family toxin [Candidatus Sulfobium mesophilum]|nr:type II toxin-antitoxin system RelE/ParE family toxin [Candidatus Sulfobium mesophilum]
MLYIRAIEWSIEYYVADNGKSPARDFINSLSAESKAKFIFIADLLTEYGLNVREPYVKPITGSRKLFEIRIKDRQNIHRVFYFAFTGRKLILLHGFTKKTDKLPSREIEIAEARMKDYLARRG